MRPAKNPDATSYNPTQYGNSAVLYPFPVLTPAGMSDATYANFKLFYAQWVNKAYTQPTTSDSFPFTQLGYTYFWGNTYDSYPPTIASQVQGATEFILLGGTSVNIYGIYSTASYIYTKNNGQYGNGYASFNITGPCDTVWAGHSFQNNVSRDKNSPNQIIIGNGATMSGGEGILVWSLNYTVTNNGIISGATSLKDKITATDNIAILFEGDTSVTYGVPILEGKNTLINSGTISNPGTAVWTVAGDTTITNNAGATISGDNCAIHFQQGTNTITNNGTISSLGTTIQADAGKTDITNGGTIDLYTGNVFLPGGGKYTQNPGGILKLTANSSTAYGRITTTVGSTLDAASTINITIGGYIPDNTTFTVVNTGGLGVGALPGTLTASSPIFAMSGSAATGNLVLTATRANTYNSFASNSNTASAGSVLNALAASNNASGDMVTVLGALDSLTSATQINEALNSLLPDVDNSSPQTTQMALDQFLSTIFAHLDAVKNVTNDALTGPDMWASGFGSYIHQDERSVSNGYNGTIWGTALGYDIRALDHLRLGLSGGFAQDFIRSKDSSARNDINNYQGTLYGSYAKGAYYIDTAFSFAYNTYDASRHVTVGALDRTATGDYNGQQYSAYIGGGYKFTVKFIELTPLASFQYSHLRLNSYTEDGAGAANLKVDPQDYDVAQTGLGMKFGYPVNLKGGLGMLTPELKFKWLYDWIGDAQQGTSAFTGGGGSFSTRGFTPAQSSYDLGAKLILETGNFITVSLSYDLEIKEDFYGHYGLAEVRYRF